MSLTVDRTARSVIASLRIVTDAGAAVTGLAHNSSGLVVEYKLPTEATWTAINLVAGTLGTWIAGGFIADSGADGWYQLGVPDAAIAAGVTTRLRIATTGNGYRYGAIEATSLSDSSLTGDFAIAVTIQDASNNAAIQNAKVRLYRSGFSGTQPTNVSGLTTFGCDAATWSVVVTASGYVAYTGTLVVTANASVTIQLTAATVTPPADPPLANLVVLCIDKLGEPEPGVSVKAKISKIPASGTGYAYDATVQEATSGVDGIATLKVVRLATYLVKRGTSKEWTTVVIADEATTEVKSFVGAP